MRCRGTVGARSNTGRRRDGLVRRCFAGGRLRHRHAAGLRDASAEDPAESLRIRIGPNAGEPVKANHDLYGATVNLARRVCDAAAATEIVVSHGGAGPLRWESVFLRGSGEARLKGFSEPARLFRVFY